MLVSASAAIPFSSAMADAPKKAGSFKRSHFNKRDHAKFTKVKKRKAERTSSSTHPSRKLQRYDSKKMHSGDTRSYIFGIPINKKGYKPQKWDR